MADEFQTLMVKLLPRFRRFAVALTGYLDLISFRKPALSRVEQWQPGTRLDSRIYRIAQHCGSIACAPAGSAAGRWASRWRRRFWSSDGHEVVENRLTLSTVCALLVHLPNEQRVLVGLVCIDRRSNKEAAEITKTPIGTVIGRQSTKRSACVAGRRLPGHTVNTQERL